MGKPPPSLADKTTEDKKPAGNPAETVLEWVTQDAEAVSLIAFASGDQIYRLVLKCVISHVI